MTKKAKVKKLKAKTSNEDVVYDDTEEGEWVDEEEDEGEVTPMAVPAAVLPSDTTVTTANPTPPTNVPVVYQGTPPTTTGLVPAAAPAPDVDAADMFLFKDPLNGATARAAVVPPATVPATAPAAELAGKAEFSGLTSKVDAAHGRLTVRGIAVPAYSETPNAGHPSYGT